MPLLDYTTSVAVSRTVSQVQAKLVEHGARAVMTEYDDHGKIRALAFKVKTPNGELPIRLPIDTAATLKVCKGSTITVRYRPGMPVKSMPTGWPGASSRTGLRHKCRCLRRRW
jgi:hypothetical protein